LRAGSAGHTSSPWLGVWTVLAAATGARNGELCGLEWADLDLDAGTVQFRQAPTIDGGAGPDGRCKELAEGAAIGVAQLSGPTRGVGRREVGGKSR
jgi:integrase